MVQQIAGNIMDIEQATVEQRIQQALKALANVDEDMAQAQNNVGFNASDTKFGHSLSMQNRLTSRQVQAASNMLRKYTVQLEGMGIELPSAEEVAKDCANRDAHTFDLPAQGTSSPVIKAHIPEGTIGLEDDLVIVKWPKSTKNFEGKLQAARDLKSTYRAGRYNPGTQGWEYPLEALEDILKAFPTLEASAEILAMQEAQRVEQEAQAFVANAEQRALLEALGDLTMPLPDGRKLYQHQQDIIKRMVTKKYHGFIDAHDVGLGKTIEALVAAKAYQKVYDCPVFVLAAPIAIEMWRREAEAVEVNVEIFSWGKVPPPPDDTQYVFIADECHRAQSGVKSARGKAYLELAAKALVVFALTGTPIPNARPANLFPLLQSIKHPLASNKSQYEARYCNAHLKNVGRATVWDTTGSTNLKELNIKIADSIEYRRKRDCLDMPTFQRLMKPVAPSSSALKDYYDMLRKLDNEHKERVNARIRLLEEEYPEHVRSLIADMVKAIEKEKIERFLEGIATYGNKDYHSFNLALSEKIYKLLQEDAMPEDEATFSDLFIVNELHIAEFREIAEQGDALVELGQAIHATEILKVEATVEQAIEVIEEGHQIVIFSKHPDAAHNVAQQLATYFELPEAFPVVDGTMSYPKRQEIMDHFQAKQPEKPLLHKVFIATMGAASESITLTEAHHMILMSRGFTPKELIQVEGRIDRVSQEHDMQCFWMCYGEIDAYWDKELKKKETVIEQVLKGERKTGTEGMSRDVAERLMQQIFSHIR